MQVNYLSVADIVKMTGVSKKTVWNWCKSGKLKASRPGGRDYVIREDDFLDFMRSDNGKKASKGGAEIAQGG